MGGATSAACRVVDYPASYIRFWGDALAEAASDATSASDPATALRKQYSVTKVVAGVADTSRGDVCALSRIFSQRVEPAFARYGRAKGQRIPPWMDRLLLKTMPKQIRRRARTTLEQALSLD